MVPRLSLALLSGCMCSDAVLVPGAWVAPQSLHNPIHEYPCRNVSKVPLAFALRASPPFALDSTSFELQPGEGGAVLVAFDPNYR